MRRYWDYYKNDFDWNDEREPIREDVGDQPDDFMRLGFDAADAAAFAASGYIVLESEDVVIDRYYGGLLASRDGRSRFPLDRFKSMQAQGRSRANVLHAASAAELSAHLDQLRESVRRPLLFRGQIHHYPLSRARPNPHFAIDGIGELSLLPSLWRRSQNANPKSLLGFHSLLLSEWSKVIYSRFDLDEVRRRDAARSEHGLPMSYSDMEDSDDPLLQRFGRVAQDLNMGHDLDLANLLTTSLQHYGLLTPYLDLTTDLDIALFFASHRYNRTNDGYDFVGNHGGKSVLYVFRQSSPEMAPHVHHRVLDGLEPLRPVRQSCVICRTSQFAMNLAADFLLAVIALDFEIKPGEKDANYLFPSQQDDAFLAALRQNLRHPEHVAGFRGSLGP